MIKLKDLIKEAKVVKVPKFKTSKDVSKWLKSIPANAKVSDDVWDPETGEVFMEKGDTKAKLAKKDIKTLQRYGAWDKWDNFYFHNDRHATKKEFEQFFNVVYKDNSKISDEDKEMLIKGGYEWDFLYPSKIKRKDGKPFTEHDVENIKEFGDWYGQYIFPGGHMFMSVGVGDKIADGSPEYR